MEAAEAPGISAIRRTIVRRWPVVLLIVAIAVAASAVAVEGRSEHYDSTGQLLIVPLAQYDQTFLGTRMFRDSGDATLTAATAAQVLHTDAIAAAASAQLADGTTADAILADVRVTATADTNVLRVVASADSAARARRVATAFVEAVVQTRARTIRADLTRRIAVLTKRPPVLGSDLDALQAALRTGTDPTVQVAQLPGAAQRASATSAVAILALALVGGVFLGLLAALGLDQLGGRVLDEPDARRIFHVAVWASVPALPRRARPRSAVAPSRQPAAVRAAYDDLAAQIGRWDPSSGVFALISAGDGDGRTTSAAAISSALAKRGRRPALVSLDVVSGNQFSADLAAAGVELFAEAKHEAPRPVREILEEASRAGDIVVVDGPPVSRAIDLATIALSAQLVLVVRIGHTTREQLAQARDVLEEMGIRPVGMIILATRAARARRAAAEADGHAANTGGAVRESQ